MNEDATPYNWDHVEQRDSLLRYAYNICGSMEDAKDIVHDVFVKFSDVDQTSITDTRNYLIRMVINQAISVKKRIQKGLVHYPGEWLPEPLASESADIAVIRKEVLSYSLMILLEKLDVRQRAVFILKEAFDYSHSEIGNVLGISSESSRQLLSRAKRQLKAGNIKEQEAPADFLDRYLSIIQSGDMRALEDMLSEDVMLVSDGGGKVSAALKPVYSSGSVSAFISGVYKKFYNLYLIKEAWVNQQPALIYLHDGEIVNCQIFGLKNGLIAEVYFIRNPDKLRALKTEQFLSHYVS